MGAKTSKVYNAEKKSLPNDLDTSEDYLRAVREVCKDCSEFVKIFSVQYWQTPYI